jgi:antitoxin ParD1/3/4
MSQFHRLTITLTDEHSTAVQAALASGNYGSSSEVIREALREWTFRQQEKAALRAKLQADIDAGLADMRAGRVREWTAEATDEIKQRGRSKLRALSSDSPPSPNPT